MSAHQPRASRGVLGDSEHPAARAISLRAQPIRSRVLLAACAVLGAGSMRSDAAQVEVKPITQLPVERAPAYGWYRTFEKRESTRRR